MSITYSCEFCGKTVEGEDLTAFGDAFIAHVRADHADFPFPDVAVRNFAEATQRLADPAERLESIGPLEIHPVTEDRIDDWLTFFDRDAFAGNPAWAACYCLEPHVHPKGARPDEMEPNTWQHNREAMEGLLRSGRSFGYLAYVGGRPAGWVNASLRSSYALFAEGEDADPPDQAVVGVSCFVIAPPYRRHGLAAALLDRVLADAPGRGVAWVEAYPFDPQREGDGPNFRGPRSMYDERGFAEVDRAERHAVVRRRV